ncbi:hypothetical protein VNG_0529H [Halobacterium salinarum NRC-1]|uniref:Spurious ORF n=1 Tax=Halobacterium salinarum (strain ATCC 700922 / JCM 11081 / NRC-1) TaxID=64091 RepID=Q9HRV4_HALSA|nr:hypothetical protein VNG_0529H [Halobacterium salinarum NRC-1]DAC77752.1 TPA_inf: spurious ORF [Halobacterium salinarum NRC-1]
MSNHLERRPHRPAPLRRQWPCSSVCLHQRSDRLDAVGFGRPDLPQRRQQPVLIDAERRLAGLDRRDQIVVELVRGFLAVQLVVQHAVEVVRPGLPVALRNQRFDLPERDAVGVKRLDDVLQARAVIRGLLAGVGQQRLDVGVPVGRRQRLVMSMRADLHDLFEHDPDL